MSVLDGLWPDEATRPHAAPPPGPAPRRQGRSLAFIHRMHLASLDETMRMMERVEAGEAAADLQAQVLSLEMTRNYAAFGTLCGRECWALEFHHRSESDEIFPALQTRGGPDLARVIARLVEEHAAIHHLLMDLAARVEGLGERPGPGSFAEARAALVRLDRIVRSHFGYEEAEIDDALARHGVVL
jgi:hypothetical protein